MSKSVLLKSSLAKKYWMALTGLFLCLFLVGHLLGNLQLFNASEEGRRAFNEYGYFMTHNIFVKILSYLTYISILFHAIDGILLAVQNAKARPVAYVSNKPSANSSFASRNMAFLGSVILIFIVTHMANFWWKIKFSSKQMPLHAYVQYPPMSSGAEPDTLYLTIKGNPVPKNAMFITKGNDIFLDTVALKKQYDLMEAENKIMMQMNPQQAQQMPDISNMHKNPKLGEGYKDMHSLVYAFFGQNKSQYGFETNEYALIAVVLYVLSMLVLSYHLMHGFSSAFQSLGLRHPSYQKMVKFAGVAFSIVVPLAFAAIPVYIYLTK